VAWHGKGGGGALQGVHVMPAPSNAHPSGLLYPLPVPSRKWSDISMDFIGPLPMTRSGHDAALVVVDRLSKMTHFAPTTTTVDGVGTARIFVDYVFRIHGLPERMVTDRGSQFRGQFMRELTGLLGVEQNFSTAYHPQSDGQTE